MTDHSETPEPGEIDVDPYAGADGRIGAPFVDEVGDDVAALLADPTMWESPDEDLGDRIAAAVASEAAAGARTEIDADGPADAASTNVVQLSRWQRVRPALLGAAAAVAILFGGVVVLSALSGAPQTEDFAADLVPTGLIPDVEGSVEVTSLQSGLKIELDAPTLPRRAAGEFYEGWLLLDDGRLVPIGTFHEGDGVTLWAGIERDKVVAMTITLEEAVAPDSAEQASSGRVVLKVDFPQT